MEEVVAGGACAETGGNLPPHAEAVAAHSSEVHAAMSIITFYSYKGGVGRSMALANTAVILARRGKRVLVVDWDLEAPGIERYFSYFKVETQGSGLLNYFLASNRGETVNYRD